MASNAGAANRPHTAGRIIGGIVKWFFRILGSLILVGVLTGVIVACYGAVYIKNVVLPQSEVNVQTVTLGQDSVVYYKNSETGNYEELMTLNSGESRVWVDYNDLPENLINAAVAIEDKRFYQHQGVDWKRTAGAMIGLVTGGSSYGGSTITQQTIKNLTENDAVTVKRKVTEIFQALEYEKTHSKADIMECYLNIIYLGERCYGVGSAAQAYFGKDVSELDLAECAALIGITNNPSKYDPLLTSVMTVTNDDGSTSELTHQQANKDRQEAILYQMYDQGMITYEEYTEACAEELHFVDKEAQAAENADSTESTTVWSWYEDALITEILDDMEDAGYSEEGAKLLLYSGGLSIYTSFDPTIQSIVDSIYQDYSNFDYTSANGQQLQSAITIIDNETGAVVALAGGVGEKTASLTYNRATMAKRQPGSSFKPVAVYAPAIEELGLLPSSVYDDVPYSYDAETGTTWPSNSYKYYNGLMTLGEAVKKSSNAVAVNVLNDLGVDTSYEYLTEKLGFTTLVDSRVAASGKVQTDKALAPLAMGGLTDGVTTIEMAAAYTTFSREGVYTEPYLYTSIVSGEGTPEETVVLSHDGTGENAFSSSTAYYMTEMLEQVVESGTGTAAQLDGQVAAGKTGTTTNNYDRWFCGYTPYYTAAVWTGYDQNEKITTTTNVSAVVWQEIMTAIHADLPEKDFDAPGDTKRVTYCLDSGCLPTDACLADQRGGRTETGTFLVGDQPTTDCTVHQMVNVVSTGSGYRLAASGVSTNKTLSVLNIARASVDVLGATPRDYEYTYNYMLSLGYAGSAAYDNYWWEQQAEEEGTDTDGTETTGGTTEATGGGTTGGTTGGEAAGGGTAENTGGGTAGGEATGGGTTETTGGGTTGGETAGGTEGTENG